MLNWIMSLATKILIVDDEPAIRRFLKASLETEGFQIVAVENAAQALSAVPQAKPDLMILDLGLPDLDGMDVIRQVRIGSALPIIVLSVRNDEPGKVAALDAGADDYMVKPFGVEELLARVRAALRHRLQQQGLGPVFRLQDLTVDLLARRVTVQGREIKLSKREFELLRLFIEHCGKVMTHRQILSTVWGEEHRDDIEYLRVYVRQLRAKLGDDPANPRYFETEPGVGYRLKSE
jgi:two-component system KDP operon response regulator KdpE